MGGKLTISLAIIGALFFLATPCEGPLLRGCLRHGGLLPSGGQGRRPALRARPASTAADQSYRTQRRPCSCARDGPRSLGVSGARSAAIGLSRRRPRRRRRPWRQRPRARVTTGLQTGSGQTGLHGRAANSLLFCRMLSWHAPVRTEPVRKLSKQRRACQARVRRAARIKTNITITIQNSTILLLIVTSAQARARRAARTARPRPAASPSTPSRRAAAAPVAP